ncbi:MAG: hypothetical protein HXX16_16230 [Bacteroidales bacterium]|nr:hypothetical protein [Bacteroidales bacterium]
MKIKLVIILLIVLQSVCKSQEPDSVLVKNYKIDFAVPEQPAFNILGTNPSDILRPSDVKSLSVILPQFYNGSDIIIPQAISMEVAPFLLIKNNTIKLNEFDKKPWLYNFRISIGTSKEDINEVKYSKIALGGRITLINEGDLKSDKKYRKELQKLMQLEVKTENDYKVEFLKSKGITMTDFISNEEYKNEFENYLIKKQSESTIKNISRRDTLNKIKENYKKENWNKRKLDIAYAYLGVSPDSIIKNIKSKKHSTWLTFGYPLTKKGQHLIGLNYTYVYADSLNKMTDQIDRFKYSTLSLGTRFYYGSNDFKGFIEGQYKFSGLNDSHNWLLNTGTEINIKEGIWLVFNIGYYVNDINKNNSKKSFYSGFSLRFS